MQGQSVALTLDLCKKLDTDTESLIQYQCKKTELSLLIAPPVKSAAKEMKPELFAHISEKDGKREEQTLREHSLQTAKYAGLCIGETAKIQNIVTLAGLLHDMGKAKRQFADYLEASFAGERVVRGSVNHTFAGVIYLFEKYHTSTSSPYEKLTCEIIAYAIGAHHGLFDCEDLDGRNGFMHRFETNRAEIHYDEAVANFFREVTTERDTDELFSKAVDETRDIFESLRKTYEGEGDKIFFQLGLLVRLVLSSVIYGDRRSTAECLFGEGTPQPPDAHWGGYVEYFERKYSRMDNDTPINRVRGEIGEQCRESAERPRGIYRLDVPTGGGKTLGALRYALHHAEKYRKRRVIFIIPLLGVLDQNATKIREYLKDPDALLEHHSNVIRDRRQDEESDKFRFLAESWNGNPVIISTLVQLLQILFDQSKSAICRMQALCDSVIVIDEVQSVPGKVALMFNMALNFLCQFAGATIVLSSATQPCFDELKWPLALAAEPDIVRLNAEQKGVFRRAEVIDRVDAYGMTMEECAEYCEDIAKNTVSLLIICNTRHEAQMLYKTLLPVAERAKWDIFHLSASMCQRHRADVLKVMREKLSYVRNAGGRLIRKVVCVSTQVMEAGIDISFESVIRVLAGIDNLAQAVGRCNRGNEYGRSGKVYLINLKDENLSMLRDIARQQASARSVLEFVRENLSESVIGDEATRRYYRRLFEESERDIRYPVELSGGTLYLADLLSRMKTSEKAGKTSFFRQPFLTAGRYFRVFDDNTIDVIVPYMEGEDLIGELPDGRGSELELQRYKEILNRAKPFTVSLYEWQKEEMERAGVLYYRLDERVPVLDKRGYDADGCGVPSRVMI